MEEANVVCSIAAEEIQKNGSETTDCAWTNMDSQAPTGCLDAIIARSIDDASRHACIR